MSRYTDHFGNSPRRLAWSPAYSKERHVVTTYPGQHGPNRLKLSEYVCN